ncbi:MULTISPECIES: sigma-54-dependent transcriptional regulator [Bacteroidaceae]|uniref:Sigma-54-dependent Fis family transcriptional regulator n=1 Tax=Phocaeicola vulgatus TaxID=821 RepID=A0A415DBP6_PHOVU|nr:MULTISPECIES: sigma-54 dependent transcriptional regulator [Bacteroidaceae]RHJ64894.1 sigma-54-dependent Fis family transcriptional regulator [Bacteroides thetaiotaomicron]RHJ69764.1 sigma-54-dependent Fis family transcriptional regulator [Phocaeicola vulgatus]
MKVIVVEDNPVYNDYVCNFLKKGGFDTMQAYRLSTAKKLLAKAEEDNTVLADLRLPDGEGVDLLRWMRKEGKPQPFIIMTDYAEVHTAVESMKLGSADYIPKQLVEDRLVPLIRSIHKAQEQKRNKQVPIFVRQGTAYQGIKRRVRLVAPTRMGVLILGENGTGKEHIAQHIHAQSKRADKPFVAVDCGSLSPTLALSAFFGHIKGAFTGADSTHVGYFQEANGGTLFLDEVANLPMEMQRMLLRAIQERRYRPIGAKGDKTADVRIVAATNEDLQKAVAEKRFREDLLYRLKEYTITVPPLRNCQEDIMPLAEFFLEFANKELERNIKGFDASARKALLTYPWPGNVRELKQKIQVAVLHTEADMITKENLEFGSDETLSSSSASFALRNDAEDKERILRALKQANGNRKIAAELLGIGRTTLYSKLEEYGLKYKFGQS